ncbi:MAG TPA: DotU family type IV/VI secretion system protein [Pyrinomonadaceae bacterium]|jgi:type VI secretion system protein ImpK|nr:DotU family type IV/VI secretion system protein [Pyrinomonadaceae bacterium]
MKEYGDTFLLGPFREFYRQVMRLRDQAVNGTWAEAAASASVYDADGVRKLGAAPSPWDEDDIPEVVYGADAAPTALALRPAASGGARPAPAGVPSADTYVMQSLCALLKRQEEQALRYGGTYGAEFYREAQYVMVALADEIFLNAKQWDGYRSWVSNLLESKLFGTHVAGEVFFQKLDRLLVERDPVYRDLAAVYLMALSLGFRGKYGGRDDGGQLERYRRQLFSFVFRRKPDLNSQTSQMFPEAYYHTVRDETKRKLQNPRAWLILLCAVVVAYVALTHGIWMKLTGRLFVANDCVRHTVAELNGTDVRKDEPPVKCASKP